MDGNMDLQEAWNTRELTRRMLRWEAGCPKRAQHLLKVWAFARQIGRGEGLEERTQRILEMAALVHDIGIRPALEKYGSSAGPLQEKEGQAPALAMLLDLGVPRDEAERVSFLVGHHHTYHGVEGPDWQILLEADFLVNLYEDACGAEEIRHAYETVFRTETGREICRTMYGLEKPLEKREVESHP